jgi:hypothetical protein
MTKRTEFGHSCQSSREARRISLLAFSRAIGWSPSFICAVEMGEKPAPDGYVEQVAIALGLDERAAKRMRDRELRSRHSFRFDDVEPEEAQLLAAFVANRQNLSKESLAAATKALQLSFEFSEGSDGKAH